MKEDLIREGIQRLAGKGATRSLPGIVQSVDKAKCTCDVALADQEEIVIYDVRLRATDDEQDQGMLLFPAAGSDVLITQLINGGGWFVSMSSELDSVQLIIEGMKLEAGKNGFIFNDGKLGGLIKIEELISELKKVNEFLKTMKDTFTNWTPVASDGGAALKTAMVAALQTKTLPEYNKIEDTKVKH